MKVISFHTNVHDLNICYYIDGKYKVIEAERLKNHRYYGLQGMAGNKPISKKLLFSNLTEIVKILDDEGVSNIEFDECSYNMVSNNIVQYIPLFIKAKKYRKFAHHDSHAACSFYQSNLDEALVISSDGGGDDGLINFYIFKKDSYTKLSENNWNQYIQFYTLLANWIYDISKLEHVEKFNLPLNFAGKLMGFAGYGVIDYKMKPIIDDIFLQPLDWADSDMQRIKNKLELCGIHGVIKDLEKAKMFAATIQHCFEELFMGIFKKYIDMYPNLPICLSGGGALNINLNSRIKKYVGDRMVFVPPNPNDAGVALGSLFLSLRPHKVPNLTYQGVDFSFYDNLEKWHQEYNFGKKFNIIEIAELLKKGNIIGVMRGSSEIGPRALGNRSILCDPSFNGMKDKLNKDIKFREWFRPFAPVVREETANKYFDMFISQSPFMSFNMDVRMEWREKLNAITHVDGTARVQTVNLSQNEWLYNLLTEFGKLGDSDVLLNTSFNSRGKPLCNTISEAFNILTDTKIDYIIINDLLISKNDMGTIK